MHLKIITILSLSHLCIDLTGSAIPALMPIIRDLLSLSYTQVGITIMVSNLTSSIIQPLFGYFSDRVEVRWFLPFSVLLTYLGFSLIGLAQSYVVLLCFVFINGLGVALYHPEGFKTTHFFTGDKRATGMSFFQVGGNLGLALGPLFVTTAVEMAGIKGTLFFLIIGVLVLSMLIFYHPILKAPVQKGMTDRKDRLHPGIEEKERVKYPMILLVLAVSLRSWAHMGVMAFAPFYYIKFLNGDPIAAGRLVFAFLIGGAAGTLVGGILSDKMGHKRFSCLSLAISTPLMFLFLNVSGIWTFVVIFIVGFVLISSFSVTVVMGQNILRRWLGVASGLMLGFTIGIGGVGAGVFGLMADKWGIITVMYLITVMPALGFIPLMVLPYEDRKRT